MPRKRKNSKVIDEEEQRNKQKTEASSSSDLPGELVLENILTRLPARNLGRFTSVSKSWYDSINDARFTASHFAHQQHISSSRNHAELNLVFNLLNVPDYSMQTNHFFSLQKDRRRIRPSRHSGGNDDEFLDYKLICPITYTEPCELIGYCNGLACVNLVREPDLSANYGGVAIINPSRGETLNYSYIIPTSGKYLCHGFGFDSSTKEYKVVAIFTAASTTAAEAAAGGGGRQGLFICLVFTLGAKLWRKSVTSTCEMSAPPGCSPFPNQMVTRAWKIARRSASLCGGDLVWTITNSSMSGHKIEMLLSFDIHNEKIQFIRLPTECTLLTPAINEHQYVEEVDHHLLEFKGYTCVARCEKILLSDADHQHHRHRRCKHHHSGFCCYRFKVQLYMLKDKVKQIWVNEETFDVRIKAEGLVTHPFCCFFDTTGNTTTPPTCVLSVSNQVILYWFDGEYLILYNLQMKHLKVVKCSSFVNKRIHDIFTTKMKGISTDHSIGDEADNLHFPYIDYQLNPHVENILSLKTFIPEGRVAEFDCHEDFVQSTIDNYPVGWVTTGIKSAKYLPFF